MGEYQRIVGQFQKLGIGEDAYLNEQQLNKALDELNLANAHEPTFNRLVS